MVGFTQRAAQGRTQIHTQYSGFITCPISCKLLPFLTPQLFIVSIPRVAMPAYTKFLKGKLPFPLTSLPRYLPLGVTFKA